MAIEDSWIEDHGCLTIIIGFVILVAIGVLVLRLTAHGGNVRRTQKSAHRPRSEGRATTRRPTTTCGQPSSITFNGQAVPLVAQLPQQCLTYDACQVVGQVGTWAVWQTGRNGLEATYGPVQPGDTPP